MAVRLGVPYRTQHKSGHEAGILSFRPHVDILVVGQRAVVTQRKTSRVEEWLYVGMGADMDVERWALKSKYSTTVVAAAVLSVLGVERWGSW